MFVEFLKGKIHRARVTDANLEYEGSISIDRGLLETAGIRPFEKVDVYNVSNGERFTTYAIEGEKGVICVNGAGAWKAKAGDLVIIACYCLLADEEVKNFKPKLVFVDGENRVQHVR